MRKPAIGIITLFGLSFAIFASGADFDGDGTNDIGIFRETTGLWAVRGFTRVYFGHTDDWPLPGDYDGDGTIDIGVFRDSTGLWAVRGLTRTYYGGYGDEPLIGMGAGGGRWGQSGENIYFDGNVGIGTDSPTQKLEVAGGIKLGDTVTPEAGVIRWTGTEFQGYDGYDWSNFAASTAVGNLWSKTGSDIYYSIGKIGIGTSSPGHLLHVVGGNVQFDATGSNFRTYADGEIVLAVDEDNNAANDLRIRGNGAEIVTIKDTGNVGIGTTAPQGKLEIEQSNPQRAFLIDQNGDAPAIQVYANTTTGNVVDIECDKLDAGGRGLYIHHIQSPPGPTKYLAEIFNDTFDYGANCLLLKNTSSGKCLSTESSATQAIANQFEAKGKYSRANARNAYFYVSSTTWNDGLYGANVEIENAGNCMGLLVDNDGANHGIRIDQDGALAAGGHALHVRSFATHTTAGSALVKIDQASDSSTEPALEIQNNGNGPEIEVNTDEFIVKGGSVGIGTTDPSHELEIRKDLVGRSDLLQLSNRATPNVGNTAGILFAPYSSSFNARIEAIAETAGAATGLGFWTHTGGEFAERVRIKNNGNVGIGTASPDAKLDVQGGAIKATGGLIIETRTSDPSGGELVSGRMWLIE